MPDLAAIGRVCGTIAVTALLSLLAACGPDAAQSASPKPSGTPATPVKLVPVIKRDLARAVEITGTIYGDEEATISSKVSGRIIRIDRDLGDEAAPGDTLAQIDPTDFQLALDERRATTSAALARLGLTEMPADDFDVSVLPAVQRARAESANAEARFDRARQLFQQSPPLISAQDYADIQTGRDMTRSQAEVELMTSRAALADARAQAAAVAVAQQRLKDATVTAPGLTRGETDATRARRYRVAERMVSQGEFVAEGRPLFRLVSSDIVKLRAQAPERFAGSIRAGQDAHVTTESSREPLVGRVSRVSPAVDIQTRAFMIEIEIDNAAGTLKPGAFGKGRVITHIEPGVTMVPASAVVSFAGVDRVFSVKDGKAVEHRVKLGERVDDLVELVGGLDAAKVIGGGAASLGAGAPVSVDAAE